MTTKVLILGSGGREHAIGWKIKQSKDLDTLYFAPGNAGTAEIGQNIDINISDFENVKQLVLEQNIDMVVVGPEAPLVDGIVDYFSKDAQLKNIDIIGPDAYASQLEGSKDFAKDFMKKNNIPTARYFSVTQENIKEGVEFLNELNAPYVLKADGLAAGKGVLILDSLEEAQTELSAMLNGKFGDAGNKVVIEEFLKGIELSVFVLTDGKDYVILPEAKDYKRIGEGDTGLNTGGMGSISPVPFADEAFMKKVEERIIKPTIQGFQNENMNYKGFVFIGLMNVEGNPYVIEYNVRMGDPETEVVMPRIDSDLLTLLKATAQGDLKHQDIQFKKEYATCVMLVSGGYPEAYEKNKKISLPQDNQDSILFHAGTKEANGEVLTNGGRVMAVCALGQDIDQALACSFKNAEAITFDKKYYRKDIGFDLK